MTPDDPLGRLREMAKIEPLEVDVSDFSDEYVAGFLAGQVNALEREEVLALAARLAEAEKGLADVKETCADQSALYHKALEATNAERAARERAEADWEQLELHLQEDKPLGRQSWWVGSEVLRLMADLARHTETKP